MGVQVDHLTQHAENIGDRIAVIDDRGNSAPRYVSYVAFNDAVNALANGFLSLGSGEGSHIAWWGNNSLEILTAIHAIRKSGGVSSLYRTSPQAMKHSISFRQLMSRFFS